MRKKELRAIVTFYTTSEAFACEKACKDMIKGGRLMPAPRALSADCGIAYRAEIEQKDKVKEILEANGIEYHGIHEIETY